MADLLAHSGDLNQLFTELVARLKGVASFDQVSFSLFDATRNIMRLHVWEGASGPPLQLRELPVAESIAGWTWEHQQSVVCPDTSQETRFPTTIARLREANVRAFCVLPLTSGLHRLVAIGFGSVYPVTYSDEEVPFLERVANLVALAVENSLNRRELMREKEQFQALLQVSDLLAKSNDVRKLLPQISSLLGLALQHDYFSVAIRDAEDHALRVPELAAENSPPPNAVETNISTTEFLPPAILQGGDVCLLTRAELQAINAPHLRAIAETGIETLCCATRPADKSGLQAVCVGSKLARRFDDREKDILRQLAAHMAIALEKARVYKEIAERKDKLAEEKLYLEDEIRAELHFEQIVGQSPALKHTLTAAKTVAPSDASVLVLGEIGTGKELIARAIHEMSPRRAKSFIKVNCGLLESELFGHERGAFTGTLTQKIGRLELADGGTLFLDEVGDIALELQPKLLRVLQDQEFERLGSTRTVKVNVRIIAATKRNLKQSVDAREFRRDALLSPECVSHRSPGLAGAPQRRPSPRSLFCNRSGLGRLGLLGCRSRSGQARHLSRAARGSMGPDRRRSACSACSAVNCCVVRLRLRAQRVPATVWSAPC